MRLSLYDEKHHGWWEGDERIDTTSDTPPMMQLCELPDSEKTDADWKRIQAMQKWSEGFANWRERGERFRRQ